MIPRPSLPLSPVSLTGTLHSSAISPLLLKTANDIQMNVFLGTFVTFKYHSKSVSVVGGIISSVSNFQVPPTGFVGTSNVSVDVYTFTVL